MMSSQIEFERCWECGALTGRAGRSEDSLYDGDRGPFCEACYGELPDQLVEEWWRNPARISELEAQLAAAEDTIEGQLATIKALTVGTDGSTPAIVQLSRMEERLAAAEVYMEAMTHALHGISLCSQNSMSDKRECGTIARQTIAAIDAARSTEI